MKPLVYIETSVISYLASKPARDVVSIARQTITHEWWDNYRDEYRVIVSALVEEEVSGGDEDAAARRLAYIAELAYLDVSEEAVEISEKLLASKAVPKGSEEDALHIGIAASHGVDFLLTWNFKHINNASMRQKIANEIACMGFKCPQLCSPEELGGIVNDS